MAAPQKLPRPTGPLLVWLTRHPEAAPALIDWYNTTQDQHTAARRKKLTKPPTYSLTAGASYDQDDLQALADQVTALTTTQRALVELILELLSIADG